MAEFTPVSEIIKDEFRHRLYQEEVLDMIRAELDRHEEKQSRFGVLLAIAIFLAASAIGFAVGLLF